ncbi:MAG: iron export ABC transporter permease subunit FetB [Dysgonamonadaceae bacterium]|jgi:putative ABC transport system permease protein|nr:iron export ABC transporter permease subunit FetB [Dysgonamonadaceae bacterium]
MNEVVALSIGQFSLIYLLLLIVLFVMKKSKIHQTKLLLVASLRMTVQLVLAGFILTYIFENPHPAFTIFYLLLMTGFAIYMILSRNKTINRNFKLIVALSLAGSGIAIVCFFIITVVGVSIFNPQYTIPIGGMIIGNAMTGVSLGLKTFDESIKAQHSKINTLINVGATPQKILIPFVNQSVETALLPTLYSMLSMGVISLPGMMTGQILSGTLPMTAIFYQIAIVIAITAVTCLAVFCSLYFGYKTLYNERNQFLLARR